MRVRARLGLCLVLLCALVRTSLGVTEFDPHLESPRFAAVEDHSDATEGQGHCHPGIDCAPAVIFLALHVPEVTPSQLGTPRLSKTRLDKGWRFTDDPPPPRPLV